MLLSLRHLEGTNIFGLQNLGITSHKLGHGTCKIFIMNLTLSASEAKETRGPKLRVQS